MSERDRIMVQLYPGQKSKIERRIKEEYPVLKNVSELTRAALKEFLDKDSNQPLKNKGEKPRQTFM